MWPEGTPMTFRAIVNFRCLGGETITLDARQTMPGHFESIEFTADAYGQPRLAIIRTYDLRSAAKFKENAVGKLDQAFGDYQTGEPTFWEFPGHARVVSVLVSRADPHPTPPIATIYLLACDERGVSPL